MVPYTLITGSKNISSWGLRGYLAVRTSGAPFSETEIPLLTPGNTLDAPQYSPDGKAVILKHLPSGKVPTLKISGGPFLFGCWSIADTMFAPMTFRLTGYCLACPPEIAAYIRQVQSLEAIRDRMHDARKEEESPS